jgi:hypothetical protein
MSLLSATTLTCVGLTCKAFIKLGWASLSVQGLHHLKDALNDETRLGGRGVITGQSFFGRYIFLGVFTDQRSSV